jgi:hypothetical protein
MRRPWLFRDCCAMEKKIIGVVNGSIIKKGKCRYK